MHGITSPSSLRAIGACVGMAWGCSVDTPKTPAVWEREPDLYVAHPRLYLTHKAGARRVVDFPEHPEGGFVMATEAHGFREDGTVAARSSLPRTLLVGDSHLAGVVNNTETAAAVLERRLGIDVVNGATGYWGPDEYAAFFGEWVGPGAKTEDLSVDACVVVFYLGNDFLDGLASAERRGELRLPRPADHGERMVRAWEQGGEVVSQLLNQDAVLALRPDLGETALTHALDRLLAARDVCSPRFFGVVLLPTRLDVDPAAETPTGLARAALGLAPAMVGQHRALGEQLAVRLGDAGVPVLHALPVLRAANMSQHGVFWAKDWHLSTQGHATVGAAMAAEWGPLLRP